MPPVVAACTTGWVAASQAIVWAIARHDGITSIIVRGVGAVARHRRRRGKGGMLRCLGRRWPLRRLLDCCTCREWQRRSLSCWCVGCGVGVGGEEGKRAVCGMGRAVWRAAGVTRRVCVEVLLLLGAGLGRCGGAEAVGWCEALPPTPPQVTLKVGWTRPAQRWVSALTTWSCAAWQTASDCPAGGSAVSCWLWAPHQARHRCQIIVAATNFVKRSTPGGRWRRG